MAADTSAVEIPSSGDDEALQPYGERRAAMRDPFGNQWYLAAPAR